MNFRQFITYGFLLCCAAFFAAAATADNKATKSAGSSHPKAQTAPVATADATERTTDAPVATADATEQTTDATERTTDAPVATADATERTTDAPIATAGATERTTDATEQTADSTANSALSFLSLFSAPVEEAPPQQPAASTAPAPKTPLPARPPADNTPKTLPQPYGDAALRASKGSPSEISPWGPFYWTLSPQDNALGMERKFAAGPFWEQRTSPTREDVFLRPLWIDYNHLSEGRHDLHILPPAFTRRQTPLSYEWDIFLFINYTRLGAVDSDPLKTFMIFPFFFWHEDPVQPEKSFWGLFPVYGEIMHFFSFQRWQWVLFPLYTKIQSWYGVTRTGVPYPFIQYFSNEADTASGLYLWPLFGHSELEGVYHRMFWMWPLVYREVDQLHRPVPRVRQGFLPFYAFEYSEYVEDVSILMFWGWRQDDQKQYHETRYLWPLWLQGRSPERYVNRWAPFYTHSKTPHIEKWWYMWPAVQHRKVPEQGVLMERSQFFYFLYWHETQTSIEHPELPKAQMRFIWPFYASYDNGAGISQLQVLSLFEVFFPHNRAMRDTYSPLFSLYRQEADASTGLKRWSLLWNLVGSLETSREDARQATFHIWPLYQENSTVNTERASDSWSILFGLLGWESATDATASATDITTAADTVATQTSDPAQATAAAATAEIDTLPPQTKNTLTLFWFDIDL